MIFLPFSQPLNDPSAIYGENLLTNFDLDRVFQGLENIEFQKGITMNKEEQSSQLRKSKIKWIPQIPEWYWLYQKFHDSIVFANNQSWNFDLVNIPEYIQYTEYSFNDNGHYGWHLDIGEGRTSQRKISITIQLSSPEEYEGGNLEFFLGGDYDNPKNKIIAEKEKGMATIFPSYMLHRVTPVTKGIRKSLVLWVGGAPFR